MAIGCLSSMSVMAESSVNLIPKVNGTLRTRYEWVPEDDEMRFQVRNARVGLTGFVCPIVDYKAEVELCDRGKMKCLDVWGRVALSNNFKVQLGNMRVPFTLGSSVAPHNYIFANRPTTDKQMGSPRNVGVKFIATPFEKLSIEGGAFNSTSNTDQTVWQDKMAAAAKARLTIGDVQMLVGYETLAPYEVRMNHAAFGAVWKSGRWHAEGEYVYRHYTNGRADDAHAYEVTGNYAMPVKAGVFNNLSFQGRFDGITDNSNGLANADGVLTVTDPAFNRISVGSTISYVHSAVRTDFRINYEHYMYHSGAVAPLDSRSKIVAELVVRF